LTGEANDYVGKGMAGGELIIKPASTASFKTYENTIIGNTVLYGATGGTLYAAGGVGERFCVRNSGATAVVEGVGDHGCEYMTAGTVVVIGETGRNFGAGMTGGTAYILDEKGQFEKKYNSDWVKIEKMKSEADVKNLMALIQNHAAYTGSQHAENILTHWEAFLPHFWKVVTPPPPPLPAPVQLKRRAASRRERKKR
jgi:glutamate synthase domain-containing protein 3